MYKKLLGKNLLCTGCGACVNICSSHAIDYIFDNEKDGSLVAKIDYKKCISCGQCERVCPVLTRKENTNIVAEECYAVWANDELRMHSSSGGIFSALAEEILERKGYVCAVAYGEEFQAEHIIISDKRDLGKLRRSKYMQSNPGSIYREIRKLLNEDQWVMFVGTPCQVAGLKSYLGKKYSKLLLVDIYCNYTPSYPVFKKYLDENYKVDQIEKIDFRVKKYGWIAGIHTITYKDGKIEEKREYNDAFQRGYHPKLFMRKTCEDCHFAGNPRQGDLSIADFWYIGDFDQKLDDKRGTSCVVVNNETGNLFFDSIKEKLNLCQRVPIDWMRYNRQETTQAHPGRDRFYDLVKKKSFNDSVDCALNGKYDVAIWGNWSEKNYGSELTYYALYKVVSSLGYDALMVERPRNAEWAPNEKPVLFKENPYPKDAVHPLYPDKVSMYELNQKCDIFLVGSDQIWHRNLYYDFGSVAFLDYIYNEKKKIAYASSFGRDYWSGNDVETQEAAFFLNEFDHISVREPSGVSICRNYFHVDADWVLDPVFLCDKKNYVALADKAYPFMSENYIGGYVLDIDDAKLEILRQLQEKLGMACHLLTDAFQDIQIDTDGVDFQRGAYCEDWLSNIINSEFVITDSFHGMCFAIIFNKQFIAFCNEERGSVRFTDLLNKLGLMERLITEQDCPDYIVQLLYQKIDFSEVNAIIEKEKIRSLQWLCNALETPKSYQMTDYDVLIRKIQNAETAVKEVERKLPYIESELGNRKWDIQVHRKELDERRWDIQVHRKELDEHLEMIKCIAQKQTEIEEKVNRMESYWIIRMWRKISGFVHRFIK